MRFPALVNLISEALAENSANLALWYAAILGK